MMAPSAGLTYHLHGLIKVAIIFTTVAFIFSLTLLIPKSESERSDEGLVMKERKAVIGSKPPACVNKCMNCRPCMATVVVPNHTRNKGLRVSSHDEDDSYYLLSWKCTCGNKLFHP